MFNNSKHYNDVNNKNKVVIERDKNNNSPASNKFTFFRTVKMSANGMQSAFLNRLENINYSIDADLSSICRLRSGEYLCGLDNGQVLWLNSDLSSCKATLDGHIQFIQEKLVQRELLNQEIKQSGLSPDYIDYLLNDSASKYDKYNVVKIILEHSKGKIITSSDRDKSIYIYDNINESLDYSIKLSHAERVINIKEMQDGSIISASPDNVFIIWDVDTGTAIKSFPIECSENNDCFSVTCFDLINKNTLAIGGLNGYLCIWELNLNQGTYIKAHKEAIGGMVMIDNGFITISDDCLRLWNTSTWDCIKEINLEEICSKETDNMIRAVYPLNQDYIFVTTINNISGIWNITTGEHVQTIEGNSEFISGVCTNNDGDILLVSADQTIRTWSFDSADSKQSETKLCV